MMDMEKVIKGKEHLDAIMEVATHFNYPDYGVVQDHCLEILALLKEQKTQKFFVDESGKITPLPVVVRCKDCLYWQDNNDGYPHIGCKWREDETPDPDDFCSAGERREK